MTLFFLWIQVVFDPNITPETEVREALQFTVFNYRMKQWTYSSPQKHTVVCEHEIERKFLVNNYCCIKFKCI